MVSQVFYNYFTIRVQFLSAAIEQRITLVVVLVLILVHLLVISLLKLNEKTFC